MWLNHMTSVLLRLYGWLMIIKRCQSNSKYGYLAKISVENTHPQNSLKRMSGLEAALRTRYWNSSKQAWYSTMSHGKDWVGACVGHGWVDVVAVSTRNHATDSVWPNKTVLYNRSFFKHSLINWPLCNARSNPFHPPVTNCPTRSTPLPEGVT